MSIEINDSNLSQYLSNETLIEIATRFSKGDFEVITTSLLTEDIIKKVNDDYLKANYSLCVSLFIAEVKECK